MSEEQHIEELLAQLRARMEAARDLWGEDALRVEYSVRNVPSETIPGEYSIFPCFRFFDPEVARLCGMLLQHMPGYDVSYELSYKGQPWPTEGQPLSVADALKNRTDAELMVRYDAANNAMANVANLSNLQKQQGFAFKVQEFLNETVEDISFNGILADTFSHGMDKCVGLVPLVRQVIKASYGENEKYSFHSARYSLGVGVRIAFQDKAVRDALYAEIIKNGRPGIEEFVIFDDEMDKDRGGYCLRLYPYPVNLTDRTELLAEETITDILPEALTQVLLDKEGVCSTLDVTGTWNAEASIIELCCNTEQESAVLFSVLDAKCGTNTLVIFNDTDKKVHVGAFLSPDNPEKACTDVAVLQQHITYECARAGLEIHFND